MKYYLIVGEASGDLHASRLMEAIKRRDPRADFRFFGGDLMAAQGGHRVRHYRKLAYMGFVPVLLHLPAILAGMRLCRRDIVAWQPDVVILVDYPGFNLSMARYVKRHTRIPVFYYIAPKIWAWKEYRIKDIRRNVDQLFSILPFEVPFFERKHHYPIHYVGNPTADEVSAFRRTFRGAAPGGRPVVALLAGSRVQEIRDNLPAMLRASAGLASRYELVVAAAPGVDMAVYRPLLAGYPVRVVRNQTYPLLAQATAALVTSGTATLETALFGVPQVVCYRTPLPRLVAFLRRRLLKVPYISLVNLIAGREVVPELVADTFTVDNIRRHLLAVLPGGDAREKMLAGYGEVRRLLGGEGAPDNAARLMVELLEKHKN